MNSHANPTKLTGSPCSCGGSSKPCKCGGGGGCDCGGACQVDTMVRPRFFAGQLLTEDDLQSLQDYVLAKNRLHNRHLFGTGVVCGLEVLCDPCGGGHVAVQPGYALDCCGNDISLDCRISLDINAMVRDLRRDQLGGHDCGDPCTEQQLKLNKSTERPPREYCLYVRYCEQGSDPVSPYAVDEPCGAQTCEPSRIREGIRFELRCRQPDVAEPGLLGTIKRCFADVVGLEKAAVDAMSLEQMQSHLGTSVSKQTFNELRARLLDLIDRSPHLVHCKRREEVLAVQPPTSTHDANTIAGSSGGPAAEVNETSALKDILVEILMECMCMAVNPPCAPCDDTGVLLACLKIKECEVIEICNLHRRFVMTPVALRYWSSFAVVERFAEQLCCGELNRSAAVRSSRTDFLETRAGVHAATTTETEPVTVTETQPMMVGGISAVPATYLKALTKAFSGVYPRKSVEAAGFDHLSEAFAIFAGEKPAPGADKDLSDTARKAIEEIVAKQMRREVNANMEEAVMAADPVKHLQDQIDDLKAQLTTPGKRVRKPSTGQPKPPTGDPQ